MEHSKPTTRTSKIIFKWPSKAHLRNATLKGPQPLREGSRRKAPQEKVSMDKASHGRRLPKREGGTREGKGG